MLPNLRFLVEPHNTGTKPDKRLFPPSLNVSYVASR